MRTPTYPSDLTDAEWALVEPFIPVYPGGRPRTTRMRDVVDAVFYLLRTGCQWRYLPKDFPPRSTVWGYFDEWRHNGTLDHIHDALRERVRRAEGREPTPSAGCIDSQSVKAPGPGEAKGTDGNKKVKGRKRHVVVDTLGLLLAVVITPANVDDGAAAPQLLAQLPAGEFPRLSRLWADSKYHNHGLNAWLAEHAHFAVEVVSREPGQKGFVPLPKRWVVERTFAWLNGQRRLTADRERTTLSAAAMVKLAMVRLMLQRLHPPAEPVTFGYRKTA
jgi:transposase